MPDFNLVLFSDCEAEEVSSTTGVAAQVIPGGGAQVYLVINEGGLNNLQAGAQGLGGQDTVSGNSFQIEFQPDDY